MTIHNLETRSAEVASDDVARKHHDIDGMIWMLLAGVIAPPLLTLVNLQINHSLSLQACGARSLATLHVVSSITLALVLLSGAAVGRCLRKIWMERAVATTVGWLAITGIFESAAFATGIIMQWPPSQILIACS